MPAGPRLSFGVGVQGRPCGRKGFRALVSSRSCGVGGHVGNLVEPPSVCQWHPCRQLYGKFGRCLSHGARGSPSVDASAGFPLNSVAPPVCGTLVAFWTLQPVPLPASYKFNSSPKGSFPVNSISTQGAVFFPPPGPAGPWLGTFSLPALAHSSRPWLLACFTDQLWPRAT